MPVAPHTPPPGKCSLENNPPCSLRSPHRPHVELPSPGGPLRPPPLQTQATSIERLDITSTPAAGDEYLLGETITIQVTLDQAVMVDDTPELPLKLGEGRRGNNINRVAYYTAGSETTTLTFEYMVFIGDVDDDGISVPAGDLQLDTTTTLSHSGLSPQSSHKVALPVATIQGHEIDSVESASVAEVGDRIRVTVGMDPVVPPLPKTQRETNTYEAESDPRITGGIHRI